MRDTSIEAYHVMKNSGLLSQRRLAVYEMLCTHGSMTISEIWDKMTNPKPMLTGVSPRMVELKRIGVIEEDCTRKCKVTGNNAIAWKITKNLPSKIVKSESNKQKIERLEKELSVVTSKLVLLRSKCRCGANHA